MNLSYPYTVEPQEGGGLFVQFVDIEEAFTEGATPEEAAFNAAEVLSGILAHRLERGDAIPTPSTAPDLAHIAPGVEIQSAILLRQAARDDHRQAA